MFADVLACAGCVVWSCGQKMAVCLCDLSDPPSGEMNINFMSETAMELMS